MATLVSLTEEAEGLYCIRYFDMDSVISAIALAGTAQLLVALRDRLVFLNLQTGSLEHLIACFNSIGQEILRVKMPVQRPTCPSFGGTDLSDLYLTSAIDFEFELMDTEIFAGNRYFDVLSEYAKDSKELGLS